ncbi:MAG: glycoside hydrolase family 3 C-terminal domain-containing protein [Bacteroidales bacterium]|nr:glycoside hydrolase family 3 C-terminal domain-containing protein [Bacteroidales bacterium]
MKKLKLILLTSLILFGISCKKLNTNNNKLETKVDSILAIMTLDEKIGQLNLVAGNMDQTGPTTNKEYEKDIKDGRVGAILNVYGVEQVRKLQELAVKNTRLRIPLLFGYDVIHGFKTIFPIPLAEACSWDIELIEKTARLSAEEACAAGLNWTFSPMVDIARDPRWGRVAEGSGEDCYLASLIAKARVIGYQGEKLNDPLTMAACVKHFAAYGAPIGGRDYNTVDMSDRMLRETYLPPYKTAVDAGVATVMSSFNELDGVPSSGNKYLLTQILRNEWGFKGFVVSDWTAINEMVNHGYAASEKKAGELALNAGLDMDMQGAVYFNYLKKSLDEGKISEKQLNESVRRILKLKYNLGLFANPYLYLDNKREKEITYSKRHLDHALLSAKESIVLLKNTDYKGRKLLPLSKSVKKIALIGPLADNKKDMLGTWNAQGDENKVTTILAGLKSKYPESIIEYTKGSDFNGKDKVGFNSAITLALKSDIVICTIGENIDQSGEAASRSEIGLPGVQQELMEELVKTGKPIIAIVMAGRPLTIEWLSKNVNAILFAGHLGTRAGDAIADVLSGDYNPSGKLVMTFPRSIGQVPIFYSTKNTGRPFDAKNSYTSKYLDISNDPLFPFGFGLSYTSFEYSNLKLSKQSIQNSESLTVTFTLKNTGKYDGEEVAQLYIRDLVGSVTRPVKELKGFKKVFLKSGEQKELSFSITENDLKFYDANMKFLAEPGKFKVFVGSNSVELLEADFELL